MKRFEFLKKLSIGVTASVVAPSVFVNQSNTKFMDRESIKEPKLPECKKVFASREDPTWASVSSMRSMTLEEMIQTEAIDALTAVRHTELLKRDLGNYHKLLFND